MPYIKEEDREKFDKFITEIVDGKINGPGELNYIITKICDLYLFNMATPNNGETKIRYQMLNEIIGVLECAKQEFYRRVCVPYEEKKKKESGDVYINV